MTPAPADRRATRRAGRPRSTRDASTSWRTASGRAADRRRRRRARRARAPTRACIRRRRCGGAAPDGNRSPRASFVRPTSGPRSGGHTCVSLSDSVSYCEMRIAVVGTGYVGLVVGACLSENGNNVACVDKDLGKIEMLRAGQMPIYEPGLEEIVRRNHEEERPAFTSDLPAAVGDSDIVFIAVGTPQGEDGSADLQHVLGVAGEIGRAITKYTVVVDKSTVPVGTAARVKAAIAAETTQPFSVVSNPEFLKQGAAIEDFMKPDRVVIGSDDERSADAMKELYAPFTRTGAPIMLMDTASAELCKYAANSILAC